MPGDDVELPASTYRLQLTREFGFDDAAAVADYVAELGVSHAYCSPYLRAAPGSTHGYDVVDHSQLNPELGGAAGHGRMTAAFGLAGLRQVLDIVPNHMAAIPGHNPQWTDLLRHGRSSAFASWFDIDWDAGDGKVLLPVLGDDVDVVIERGELQIDTAAGVLRYHEHEFPLADGSATDGDDVMTVVAHQHYVLANWRRAATDLNYRRFFDVTTLVGVRVEDQAVFDATHATVRSLVDRGDLHGLRVDHPDGLADPRGYTEQLRAMAPAAWLVVEKILEPGERLRDSWPVHGTTGYDAAAVLTRVFVDPAGGPALDDVYSRFTGESAAWPELAEAARRDIVRRTFRAEVGRLVRLLAPEDPAPVGDAISELLAALPVYRTYVRSGEPYDAVDKDVLGEAAAAARRHRPELGELIDKLTQQLLEATNAEFTTRFQQTSGAVRAKGVEDTAFYRYHRLAALNEVGADPGHFAVDVATFHDWCRDVQATRPATMTTLSTHDTKRSEDVRARLLLLSEIPQRWGDAVTSWSTAAQRHWSTEPDRNIEYLLWQTIVGAYPLDIDRAVAYAMKAAREAKQHTSWTEPDEAYEQALQRFVEAVLSDGELVDSIAAFVETLRPAWWANSVSIKLVQLTMPGVPDVYQGSELWDLSLVDPDNRRPVDFRRRRELLAAMDAGGVAAAMARLDDGGPKMLVTSRALRLRRRLPDAFGRHGTYEPVSVAGTRADRVVAFARGGRVCTIVGRHHTRADDGWEDTTVTLPDGSWQDELTGRTIDGGPQQLADLLSAFPAALLVRS